MDNNDAKDPRLEGKATEYALSIVHDDVRKHIESRHQGTKRDREERMLHYVSFNGFDLIEAYMRGAKDAADPDQSEVDEDSRRNTYHHDKDGRRIREGDTVIAAGKEWTVEHDSANWVLTRPGEWRYLNEFGAARLEVVDTEAV